MYTFCQTSSFVYICVFAGEQSEVSALMAVKTVSLCLSYVATYSEAEAKLGVAEEQSALETESENEQRPRTQRKRKHWSDVENSDDSSAEQSIQPAKVKNAGLHLKELPKPPVSLLSTHSSLESETVYSITITV